MFKIDLIEIKKTYCLNCKYLEIKNDVIDEYDENLIEVIPFCKKFKLKLNTIGYVQFVFKCEKCLENEKNKKTC